jgi:hypothetical protein
VRPGGGVEGETVDGVEEAGGEKQHVVLHAVDETVDQVRGIWRTPETS